MFDGSRARHNTLHPYVPGRLSLVLLACLKAAGQRRTGDMPNSLPLVGATHEKARIVKDGNVITAGGVTSGIDFGLALVAEIAGDSVAQDIQLSIEYDPKPPFDAGHPDRASESVKAAVAPRYEQRRASFRERLTKLSAPLS